MEPTAGAGAVILGKLLGVGYSLYKAHSKGDIEFELGTWMDLVDLAGQIRSWTPAGQPAQLQAQVIALLTQAFGRAFHEHFGLQKDYDKKRLEAHFQAAIHWAQSDPSTDPHMPPVSLDAILTNPEKSEYFSALWRAFNKRALPGKAGRSDLAPYHEPLIEDPTGKDRRDFEGVFRRTVMAFLTAPTTKDLRLAVLSTKPDADRAQWVEGLVVGDMATWGRRHVFGNVRGHTTLPAMPLEATYVEPNAVLRGNAKSEQVAICGAVREALETHQLVVVCADFGHGKSLTARTIAYQAAKTFLSEGGKPAAELERPVFIKCQSAVTGTGFDLAQAVRQAQWHVLKELGIGSVRATDPALSLPPDSQRTLYLIDGLDELAFLERDIVSLFEHLRGQLTDKHRAVVFSRPHTLPRKELSEWKIPVFELQPFDCDGDKLGQVGAWLSCWNECSGRKHIEPSELAESGLLDLAKTPILLFMIAYTWGDNDTLYPDWQSTGVQDAQEAGWDRRNRLYESFFRAIAFGKYEQDRDEHPTVVKAAEKLQEALEARGLISDIHAPATTVKTTGKTSKHKTDDAAGKRHLLTEAMLWLMSRIAWEAYCLEQGTKPKQLKRRNIEDIIERELGIEDEGTVEVVLGGLLLSMQADLSESTRPILFGHKSFREFLVGRCWASLLATVTDPNVSDSIKTMVVKVLQSGSLLTSEDSSFDFLRARLRQWDDLSKSRLFQWAHREFSDERIENIKATVREDSRRYIRAAALALATSFAPKNGYELEDDTALRSLLSSYWVSLESMVMWAPRLSILRAYLVGAMLRQANLQRAQLQRAQLQRANLQLAHLDGANLVDANLQGANLEGANLYMAYLRNANLEYANLAYSNMNKADLTGAHLAGAKLQSAELKRAQLPGAIFRRANLRSAHLQAANLALADLEEANLGGAYLQDANLSGASFSEANLSRANLRGANLSRANLYGANLYRADLYGANLDQANLSEAILLQANMSKAQLDVTGLRLARAGGATFANPVGTEASAHEKGDGRNDGVEAPSIAHLIQPSPTPSSSPPHPDKTTAPACTDDSYETPAPPSDTEKAPTP